jgi:hypothetical protein
LISLRRGKRCPSAIFVQRSNTRSTQTPLAPHRLSLSGSRCGGWGGNSDMSPDATHRSSTKT